MPTEREQRRKVIGERAKTLSFPWSCLTFFASAGIAVTASIVHGFSIAYVLYPFVCVVAMVGMLMFHYALEVALERRPPQRPLLPLLWFISNSGALFGVYWWLESSWAAVGIALLTGSIVYALLYRPIRRRRIRTAKRRR